MSELVKIGKKYTIVVPKKIRKKLGLKEGQVSEIKVEGEKLIITPKAPDPYKRLSELMCEVIYDEKTEKKAESWVLGE